MSAAEILREEVAFRPAREEDLPFIYNAWVESYGMGSPFAIHIPKSTFYPEHRHVIAKLIADGSACLSVAVLADDQAVILGFALTRDTLDDEARTVDYVYVKGAFRQMGIATALLQSAGVRDLNRCQCTHHTYDSIRIKAKWPRMIYNPYIALEK